MKFILPLLVSLLGATLGCFFIYKGIDKHFLSPCLSYSPNSIPPKLYLQFMESLCSSGFTKIVGSIEVAAGLLLIVPKTRLLGTFIILPVIITIFLIHLLMDNRLTELVETGLPLIATVLIFSYHQKNWKAIIAR